jgi:hypothetical protein
MGSGSCAHAIVAVNTAMASTAAVRRVSAQTSVMASRLSLRPAVSGAEGAMQEMNVFLFMLFCFLC